MDFIKEQEAALDEKEGAGNKEQTTQGFLKNTGKRKKIIYGFVFLATVFFVFSLQITTSGQETSGDSWFSRLPVISQIKRLLVSPEKSLKGEKDDRINILLLGMGGKYHDGGYLTDTIMLASLKPSTREAAIISIPRDLSIPDGAGGWRKINNVNAYAEAAKEGSGGQAAVDAISQALGLEIGYYVRVDFDGFINIVDELNGLKIYVENTINDPAYPIMGQEEAEPYESRFEHLFIEKGWQKMDGELALKYARSRHSSGIEGSDFARSRRQQKVLEALKDDLLSINMLFRPLAIKNIAGEVLEHVDTDLEIGEMFRLWDIAKEIKKENITNKVLDNGPSGYLRDFRTADGAYVLIPNDGNFSEIKQMISGVFSGGIKNAEKLPAEETALEIRNGTWINGLGSQAAERLKKYGFTITAVSNASQQNFQKSVIYDLTYGEKIKSLTTLKEITGANVSYNLPEWLMENIREEQEIKKTKQPDFILVLGEDAK